MHDVASPHLTPPHDPFSVAEPKFWTRKRGYLPNGARGETCMIMTANVPVALVRQAERLARELGISRSRLITKLMKRHLAELAVDLRRLSVKSESKKRVAARRAAQRQAS